MATQRVRIANKVKHVRRNSGGCKECGRTLPQGLFLGGPGPTFSELVADAGTTWETVQTQVDGRGLMCRRCLNYSTRVSSAGASMSNPDSGGRSRSEEDLLRDPVVRAQMKEKGVKVPAKWVEMGIPQLPGLDSIFADEEDDEKVNNNIDPSPGGGNSRKVRRVTLHRDPVGESYESVSLDEV